MDFLWFIGRSLKSKVFSSIATQFWHLLEVREKGSECLIPISLMLVLCQLNSIEFNRIIPYLYLCENQAQKSLAESKRIPECILACCKNPNYIRGEKHY